ncbi:MAG TPA: glycosyltransferase family 4 protein [Dehalococcoidia bacterium]|nr:glycosyltransferase family 4 protein [Dehalococcoidia bacterium]
MLILCATAELGGTEMVACLLDRELAKRGWDVQMSVPADGSREGLNWFHSQGMNVQPIRSLKTHGTQRSFKDVLGLALHVAASRADVVNLHYGTSFASLKDVLAVRLAGKRGVVSIHHFSTGDWPSQRKMLLATRLSSSVVVTTDIFRRELLARGIPAMKIRVVPNGSPVPTPMRRSEARARLGIPDSSFVIATLARLVEAKGIQDLLTAVSQANDPEGRFLVLVGGEGHYRDALEANTPTALSGHARFLGRVADPSELYAAADVFVLPSYEEGFGLVFVEAAFHGTPSIGTRVGGIPEAIIDGETGILVEPKDPQNLARAIERIAADAQLRERLGKRALERAQSEFTVELMAERYEKVLLEA